MLRRRAEVGHALHRGRAGADDADDLVVQPVEIARRWCRRCRRSPSGWCGTSGRRTSRRPGCPGSFGRCSGPLAMTTKRARMRSPRLVETIQRRSPSSQRSVGDLGLQAGTLVETEVAGDGAAVLEDLRRARVLLRRDVADLLEQRQVDVRLDVARRARVAVPVPGAAEVAALLDEAEVVDAGLAQPRARPAGRRTRRRSRRPRPSSVSGARSIGAVYGSSR